MIKRKLKAPCLLVLTHGSHYSIVKIFRRMGISMEKIKHFSTGLFGTKIHLCGPTFLGAFQYLCIYAGSFLDGCISTSPVNDDNLQNMTIALPVYCFYGFSYGISFIISGDNNTDAHASVTKFEALRSSSVSMSLSVGSCLYKTFSASNSRMVLSKTEEVLHGLSSKSEG